MLESNTSRPEEQKALPVCTPASARDSGLHFWPAAGPGASLLPPFTLADTGAAPVWAQAGKWGGGGGAANFPEFRF